MLAQIGGGGQAAHGARASAAPGGSASQLGRVARPKQPRVLCARCDEHNGVGEACRAVARVALKRRGGTSFNCAVIVVTRVKSSLDCP